MGSSRRDFLKNTALASLGLVASNAIASPLAETFIPDPGEKFVLPPLPYAYDALEPFIDKETMTLHHDKHHQGYVDKLNALPKGTMNMAQSRAEQCRGVNESTSAVIRNNLGGHYNHSIFWSLMRPGKEAAPTGVLLTAIEAEFKTYDDFKKAFSEKAAKIFGSGWCWLILDENNKLKITTTPNQDNPLMALAAEKGRPVLALDVWEHAYYLKYQNRRAEYIGNWWNVVNWDYATSLYNNTAR